MPAQNNRESRHDSDHEARATATAYARGLRGGMLLGVPVLMTMEVWWEAFFVPSWRLILLYVLNYGVLFILQHFSGLHHRKTVAGQARAALVALGIGTIASGITLLALGVITREVHLRELAGKLMLESIPVSIGASVAMSEFGDESDVAKKRQEEAGYWGSMALAVAGASLFGFGLSIVEEPLMVAMQLSWHQAILLMLLSLAQVHVTVYVVDFKEKKDKSRPHTWKTFLSDALSTYAIAVAVGAYYLWTFGNLNLDVGLVPVTYLLVTVGFITSFGAAAGELLI
jgi:putative integral membrane protein (TIGR02587 family)